MGGVSTGLVAASCQNHRDMSQPALRFDEKGLIVAIAQDRLTGELRMVAWMNREALERTLATGRATFFSRSRQVLWEKGETSGHGLAVRSVHADCDGDTLLLLVDANGPSCHTGRPTCFFRRVSGSDEVHDLESDAKPFLGELERVIRARQAAPADRSYTRSLLDGGPAKMKDKLEEEAAELARAIAEESPERVASEAADVLYHLMVGLRLRGVDLRDVIEALARRSGTSGHDEKAARPPK
jgi:phosphoribosyl-AMP cyclohydrolase / phosphoribosyl-ATP pyrophosphohydrolase